MTRRLLASLVVAVLAFALAARGADPRPALRPAPRAATARAVPDEGDPRVKIEDAAIEQDRLRRQFEDFKQALLRLKHRLEASSRQEDQDKAKVIADALKEADDQNVDAKFDTLLAALRARSTFQNPEQLQLVMRQNEDLRKDIKKIITLLLRDDRDAQLKAERERVQRLLEQLKEIIAKQERVRAQTEIGRKGTRELKRDQDRITRQTRDVAEGKTPGKKDNRGRDPRHGDAKDGGKGKEGRGEAKDDTKDPKGERRGTESKGGKVSEGKGDRSAEDKASRTGQGKDAKGKGQEGKPGEGKEGKDGAGKEGKPGEGKDGADRENKSGQGKDGQGGEGKEGKPGQGKEGKGGEGKEGKAGAEKEGKGGVGKDGKAGEGKGGTSKEGKPGDSKGGEGKPGKPAEGKPGGKPGVSGKPGEASRGKPGKPAAGRHGEGKRGGGKPGESKSGIGKPAPRSGQDSKGKAEGKGEGKGSQGGAGKPSQGDKPSASKGGGKSGSQEGKAGQSKGGGQQGGQQGGQKGGQQGGQQGGEQGPQDAQVKKQIQEGNKYQEKAGDDLDKAKKDDAGENQGKAIEKLNYAKKRLEELLKQLREEEVERLLAQLQGRCQLMLRLQIEVRDGTVNLDRVIHGNPKAEPTRADVQASNVLSDKEDDIVKEANMALRLLEAEGSAVAFAEVFQQVRGDMQTVSGHLRKTDTGLVTVTIENDVIDTLREMVEALKKARQENKQKPKQSKPGQGGMQKQDQRLIDLIAELKMIRSMQLRVNARTEVYGKQFEDEQVPAPDSTPDAKEREHREMIQRELRDLAAREQKIGKVVRDIATGKNEAR